MANLEHTRGQRLDQKVVELFPSLSRAFAAKLIEDERVSVNGVSQTKPGYRLRLEDVVTIDYSPEKEASIPDVELEVLYEDDDCVVINKPLGLLTHSKGAFNPEPTVATWLRRHCERIILSQEEHNVVNKDVRGLSFQKNERGGIVHRLDRATSGVMICAKNTEALSWLQKQFSQRRVKKKYIAVVSGTLEKEAAIIDMPIERNPKKPATFRVGRGGKPSKTQYKVLICGDNRSLLELTPETGRTHQLRVHLAHIGHPIVGDTFYGGAEADRLYLHAESLEITILAGHQRKVFSAATPKAFEESVDD